MLSRKIARVRRIAKCTRLAIWMFIRSKEMQLLTEPNMAVRSCTVCHCAVSFVLLLVKPRMIAKQLIRRNEQANRLSVCGINNVFFTTICVKSLCKYLRDRGFASVDCACME